MDNDGCLGCLSGLVIAIAVEFLQVLEIKRWPHGLVEKLDRDDDILVLFLAPFARDGLEDVEGLLDGVAL